MNRAELKIGDEVVIDQGRSYRSPYRYVVTTVFKVTKMQIVTMTGDRFHKSTGLAVAGRCLSFWGTCERLADISPDEARQKNINIEQIIEREALARLIDGSFGKIKDLPLETLRGAVELLGLTDGNL